jgi:glycosyltransferase involved in cell wall biosynthesis
MSTGRYRLGVDGRAFSSPAGGVRRYVWEIYGALPRVAPEVDAVAIGASPGDALPPAVTPYPARAFPTNLGWMAATIPLAARRARLDIYHAPAYTAPLWGVHPQAVTIHDVSYERRPEWNAYRNDRARRYFYRRSALAADRIITDSEFSRGEITAAYGIPADRIDVVPLAAGDTFTPGGFAPPEAPAGVTQPYALHVGDLHIRRNLTTALDAILALRRVPGSPLGRVSLVCAGIDRGVGAGLKARAHEARDPDALVLTGVVGEAVLVNLYRGAAMLVYPSRYEGFGLPVLESMRCGVPVVAAKCASIPELVAGAGLLLDPLDVPAWEDAIRRVLTDAALAARLRDAGLTRAAQFSWTRTATDTVAVLRECAQRARKAGR